MHAKALVITQTLTCSQTQCFTGQMCHFIGHQQLFVSTSLPNSSRKPSPRGEILVISDWFLKWLLIGCWLFSLFCSNQIVSIILVVLFFHPGVETLVIYIWQSVLLTSDWIVVDWLCYDPIKYFVSSSAFYSFKTNFLVVVGGGGGGSDVKMGCTIYWKDFPL